MRPEEQAREIGRLLAKSRIPADVGIKIAKLIDSAITSAVEEARAAGHAAGVKEERERALAWAEGLADIAEAGARHSESMAEHDLYEGKRATAKSIASAIRNGEDAA